MFSCPIRPPSANEIEELLPFMHAWDEAWHARALVAWDGELLRRMEAGG